jgi:hypothetical protein
MRRSANFLCMQNGHVNGSTKYFLFYSQIGCVVDEIQVFESKVVLLASVPSLLTHDCTIRAYKLPPIAAYSQQKQPRVDLENDRELGDSDVLGWWSVFDLGEGNSKLQVG